MQRPAEIKVASLVLTRLLAAGEKGEAGSKVRKDLEPLLSHRWTGPALVGVIDRTLDALLAAESVVRLAGRTRKAAPRFALTDAGRRRALAGLGVESLRPRTTWAVLRKTYLPAVALGMPASGEAAFKAMAADPTFKAVLLRRQFHLPAAEVPGLDAAIDALAWKLIGFDGATRKFDVKAVKTALLNRELADGRAAADFKKAADRLIARGSGARRDDAKELRDSVVRGWIDREDRGESEVEPPPPRADGGPVDLAELAGRARAAARDCPTGRCGDNKVFISHVWDRLRSSPDFDAMDLDAFKRALAEANNLRLIDLGRADLVQAMDPQDIRRSEVRYLNATFHFIRI